jgi:uncharacterized metal-binding protein YceD (DUF177 family)
LEIAFRKIPKEGASFALESDGARFEGKIVLKSPVLAAMSAKISGEIPHQCDRCGDEIALKIDENVDIMISDGIYKGDPQELDVVEMADGLINLDEILQSEIEAYKSDYFYCDKCRQGE